MKLTFTTVYKTKTTNKLHYSGDDPSVLILLKFLQWNFHHIRLLLFSVFFNSVVDHSDYVKKRLWDHCPLSIVQRASRYSLLCPWFICPPPPPPPQGCFRAYSSISLPMPSFKEYIERFHMTSRRPYWCSKTMKRRPYWCSKQILWELDSFLM